MILNEKMQKILIVNNMDFYFFNYYTLAKQRAKEFVKGREVVEGFSPNNLIGTPGLVASFLVSCFAAYLNWQQNSGTNTVQRVFYALLAFLFSGVYLLYYFFMHLDKQRLATDQAFKKLNEQVPSFLQTN